MTIYDDMIKTRAVVNDVRNRIGDPKFARLEHYDSWEFFRVSMGWDKTNNPWRYSQYLKAIMDAFPDNAVDTDCCLSVHYSGFYPEETLETYANRCRERNEHYLSCILDKEICDDVFISSMKNKIESETGWQSGRPYSLMTNENDIACKLSGLTKGYSMYTYAMKTAQSVKKLLKKLIPNSVVFICKHNDSWFIIQTWEKYIPECWNQADYEYKREVRKSKTHVVNVPDDQDERIKFLEKLFKENEDVFRRLASK